MHGNIFCRLSSVVMPQFELNINPLADCCEGLEVQAVPSFTLSDKNQAHRALGIHFEVQQESDFLQHFPIKKMGLVHDHYRLNTMNSSHKLNFPMKLPFCIASIKFRLAPELFQQPFVKMPRR